MDFCLPVTDASVLLLSGMETCGIVIVSGTAADAMRGTARIFDRKKFLTEKLLTGKKPGRREYGSMIPEGRFPGRAM